MAKARRAGGIFERARGIWWIDYRDRDGRRHRERIGRRDEAIDALTKRRREVEDGSYLAPRSRATTFRDLAALSLEDKRIRLRPQSYATDVGRLGQILPKIGEAQIEQLGAVRLERLLGDLKRTGLSGSTVNRFHALLSSIFSFGVRSGRAKSNPMREVKRFKESQHRIRYLLADEEKKLRELIRAKCPHREPELDLALYTGMRRGEQFTLKWSDVDLKAGILTVRGKSGRRYITVNASASAAIEQLAKKRDGRKYVCGETQRDDQRDWRRWFKNAVDAAGVDSFHWHDLRHTFASRLVMAGVDIPTVSQLMGHASILMTMRYAHLSPDHRAAAAEKIGATTEAST